MCVVMGTGFIELA